jgi:hypothetical protein
LPEALGAASPDPKESLATFAPPEALKATSPDPMILLAAPFALPEALGAAPLFIKQLSCVLSTQRVACFLLAALITCFFLLTSCQERFLGQPLEPVLESPKENLIIGIVIFLDFVLNFGFIAVVGYMDLVESQTRQD